MKSTRETAQAFADHIAAMRFPDAFALLADNARYRIIGKTPLSLSYTKDELLNVLVPGLASMKQPPTLTFSEIIVEGNRAVALAAGKGIGPTGLAYDQPHYAMVMRIENGQITEMIEFMDTVEVETKICGREFKPA